MYKRVKLLNISGLDDVKIYDAIMTTLAVNCHTLHMPSCYIQIKIHFKTVYLSKSKLIICYTKKFETQSHYWRIRMTIHN